MTETTVHPLDKLVEAVTKAEAARDEYLEDNGYEVIERAGFIYAVHPDYVEKFKSYYNHRLKGGWFGTEKGAPSWAAIRI